MNNNIVLIGFMGCGKTTVGNWISENKGYKFCDTDEYIVNKQNCTINEIFANSGEEFFRNLETKTILELIEQDNDKTVYSVGGGLPVKFENRSLLKKLGRVVYLDTSIDELVKRLEKDTTRPLLKGGNVKTKIQDLMEKREEIYKEVADIIIKTDGKTFEDIYNEIMKN